MGRHQRDHDGIGFRGGDAQPAGSGEVRAALPDRRGNPARTGGADESRFGVRQGNCVSQQNTYTAISYDIYKGKPQNVDLVAVTTETRSGTAIRSRRRESIFTRLSDIWRSIPRHTTPTSGTR